MVFFSCIIIVLILYYLQADGLIYVVAIAVAAELINLFLTQTLTKSVEKRSAEKFGKILDHHKSIITSQKKNIKELEKIRDESVHKLYKANSAIKSYEKELGIEESQVLKIPSPAEKKATVPVDKHQEKPAKLRRSTFDDLPAGSNRKKLPI